MGIEAGLNAGCWTIAVAATGNEMGLSKAELASLPAGERETRLASARKRCAAWGAHWVVDSVAEILPIVEAIDGAATT